MSKNMKWIVGVLVVIVLVAIAWWAFSGSTANTASAPSQPAAAAAATSANPSIGTNGTASGNPSVTAVAAFTTQIDQEIQANASALSASGAPSLAMETGIAARIGSIGSQMLSVATPLQSLMTSAKAAGKSVTASQAALSDMQKNVSSAINLVVAAQKTLKGLDASKGTANAAVLNSTLVQLKSAESNVQVARADIQTIVQASTN